MQRSLLLRRLPAWMRRTLAGRLLGLLLPTAALLAQETAIRSAPDTKITTEVRVFASAREAVPKVTERGAHHRVEQWVERIIGADGATNDVTHSYTVLANGMNYLDGGEWKETVAEFVPVKGGWLAGRGPHQVLVSDDLFVAGAVTVVSPEGQTWKSTPMTLALRDRASGQVWVLGESRATRGELVAANTVLFRDAFASEAGLRADVRVVTSAGGVECDVIVRSGVPSREALGEAGEQAELVVLTEIFEPGGATANPVDRGGRSDDVVRLGALTMDQGQAFGTDLPGEPTRSVPVFKRVYQDEPSGRVFLEEATPLDSLSPLLEALPEARLPGPVEARWRNTAGNAVLPVRPIGLLPAPAFPRRADGRFEVAANKTGVRTFAAVKATPGVVLDWSYLNSATNFTFRGNTTYYVTNLVLLSGTNVTFEGGSVVKMSGDSAAGLQVNSGTVIQWLGEPYLPISLTAKDDDSIGDKITGSTSQPGGNRYGGTYLFLNSPGAAALVQHVRFRYARTAFGAGSAFSPNTVTLRHAQVTACEAGFRFQYGGTTNANYLLQNVLLANAGTAFKDFYQARTDAAFVTFDTVTNWFASTYSPHSSTVVANDSILAAVGSVNVGFTNNCWVASGGSGLFEAVGAGAYYLPRESAVRSVTPQVEVIPPPETLLAGMSTRAPYLWTNVVTVATNLDAVVHAWVGVPPEEEAIGYHYPKLHFLCTNVVVTNAVLTLTNGVSVGFAGTVGFALKSGAVFRSTGKPDNLNRLVWAGLVQESATYTALTNTSSALFTVTAGASRPGIEARFTELIFSNPGKTLVSDTANALAALTLRDCNLFRGHAYVLPPATTSSQTISLINNHFERADFGFHHYYDSNFGVTLRNNLVRRSNLLIYYASQITDTQHPTWTLKDNLFDNATLQLTTVAYGNYYVSASHNGYTGSTATFGGSGNKTSLVPDYLAGPLGRFYYPASGGSSSLAALINAGSLTNAGLAGLFHHATTTNMVLVETNYFESTVPVHSYSPREGASTVDIGFHYVANGQLYQTNGTIHETQKVRDADGDEFPDYWEDFDGDGNFESPEFHWLWADSDYDGLEDYDEFFWGTNPAVADTDGDGVRDGMEVWDGTNPLDAYSRTQNRLGSWRFETTACLSEEGIVPTTATPGLVDSFDGRGASFTSTNQQLLLPWTRTVSGMTVTNAQFWNGTMRLTYVPSWYAGGASDKPTNWVCLLACGDWKLRIDPEGKYLVFQTPVTNGPVRTNFVAPLPRPAGPAGRIGWEITLSYRPRSTAVTVNGAKLLLNLPGLGVEADLSTTTKNAGLWVGSDANGASPALGFIDSLELFDTALADAVTPYNKVWDAELRRVQVASASAETNGLKLNWQRGWEGDWLTNSGLYSITRRPAGSTGTWTTLTNGVRTNSWVDTTAANGSYYEYRINRHSSVAILNHPTLAAARNGSPVDARGRAILLVDNTVSNAIATELESFKRDLVADGWLVLATNAPRHSDLGYPTPNHYNYTNATSSALTTNKANATALKSYLQSIYALDTNLTNVVFLVGHVTIPYSGKDHNVDGHGDHAGAWPADSWYGDLTGTWTDTSNNSATPPNIINFNAVGDGRWDQDTLPLESDGSPGRLEMAVGRIDFRLMAPFKTPTEIINNNRDDTEIRLLKLYFDKVKRWRRAQIPVQDDFLAWLGDGAFHDLTPTVQRLSARLWGNGNLESARFTNDMFLATTNSLWGIHGDYGHFTAFGNDQGPIREHRSTEVAQDGEVPRGMFQVHFGSYLGEWFHWDTDPLRVVLGMTNSTLTATWLDTKATLSIWRPDRFHLGAPYATALQDTFSVHPAISCRTTAILGDPFLREHLVAPVASVTLTKSSPNIVLSWPTQTAASHGYRIYRASSTNSLAWTWLADVSSAATGWTNSSPGNGTYAYLIKGLSLKTTGSGSYTNTSIGTFSTTEVTLP